MNVIVAGQAAAAAVAGHGRARAALHGGIGIWEWASTNDDGETRCGDGLRGRRRPRWRRSPRCPPAEHAARPEASASSTWSDLMRLAAATEHPHGLSDQGFRRAVHHRQAGHLRLPRIPVADPSADLPAAPITHNIHVRGYKEEGTTTTPFDMVVLNDLDRFHLVMDVIDRVPAPRGAGQRYASGWSTQRSPRPRLHPRARRGHAGDRGLDVAVLARARATAVSTGCAGRQRGVEQP